MTYVPTGTKGLQQRLSKLGYSSYSDYLKSAHWQKFRKRFYREHKSVKRMFKKYGAPRCMKCKASNQVLHLHHWTYKRLGKEFLGDVLLLCAKCHSDAHIKERENGGNLHKGTFKSLRKKHK